MNPARHVMIRASAGSGKTYALTNRFVALLARGAPPDRIVSGANGTWAEAGIERVLAGHFPGQRPESLKPGHATRECLGAGALLLVVLALEELQCIGKQRALVASLGWNQQAAAVWIERTPG